MKRNKEQKRLKKIETKLYKLLCLELLKIITANKIKLSEPLLKIIFTCFPFPERDLTEKGITTRLEAEKPRVDAPDKSEEVL